MCYLCEKDINMNQINIIPKIIHDKFAARIIMDDYDIEKPIVITVVARRNEYPDIDIPDIWR